MVKKNPQYELQRREHKHLEKMALYQWLSANDENVLILGAISGFGVTAVSKMMGITPTVPDGEDGTAPAYPWFTLPGLITDAEAPWYTLPGLLQLIDGKSTSEKKDLILGLNLTAMSNMGNDVASMCIALLFLKNAGPVMQGIGEMIPG